MWISAKYSILVALAILFGATSCLLIRAPDLRREATGNAEPQRVPSIDEQSAVVVDGLRLSLHSIVPREHDLRFVFCAEFVRCEGTYPGRARWAFLHPWSALHVIYYDAAGRRLGPKIYVDYLHDPAFVSGRVQRESVTLEAKCPAGADSVSVQYGASPWHTTRVAIPLPESQRRMKGVYYQSVNKMYE
jgi:hypothetical protein